jgi:hypothetical protein
MPTPKPGRPPLVIGERSESIHVRLGATAYDRLCERAARDRVSVATVARRAVEQLLDDDLDDD